MRTLLWGAALIASLLVASPPDVRVSSFPPRDLRVFFRALPSHEDLTIPPAGETRTQPGDGHGHRVTRLRRVESTAYCLRGTMANGEQVHDGAVAVNGVKFGTRYRIDSGPLAGKVVRVTDRIGHSSEFDVWIASCDEARVYGRKWIEVTRL